MNMRYRLWRTSYMLMGISETVAADFSAVADNEFGLRVNELLDDVFISQCTHYNMKIRIIHTIQN